MPSLPRLPNLPRRLCLKAATLGLPLPLTLHPHAATAVGEAAPGVATGASRHPAPAPARAPAPELPPPSPQALPTVHPDRVLRFPRDFGAHPLARTEWWYLTGWLAAPQLTDPAKPGAPVTPSWGFQLTFFRSRTGVGEGSRSAFAPRQLVLAHAAITDVRGARLWHDQQVARTGFGVVRADEADTHVRLRGWSLQRRDAPGQGQDGIDGEGGQRGALGSIYQGHVQTPDFTLRVEARSTQPLMLQGQRGYSRKGPMPAQASHYYSQPQLVVQARLQTAQGGPQAGTALQGRAWMDHEWSESVLDAQAVGWDWIGMNLDDGSALMAFRIRDRQGRAMWAGGSWRPAGGAVQDLRPDQLRWTPLQHWASLRTGARYPVAWALEVAGRRLQVQALVPDQEMDTRASTGTAYWEGLSALKDAHGQHLGWGYLEMTGYAGTLSL